MSLFTSSDNNSDNLPHLKKVWKHFMHAVRSRLYCLGIPKTSLSKHNTKRRRFSLCSSKPEVCCGHPRQHHFPPCHRPNSRHLSQRILPGREREEETQGFGGDHEEGRNYQNAPGEEQVLGDAFEGEEGENGNFVDGFTTSSSSSSSLHVVDVKAQEFIEDFYERLKLERQHSREEYYKMLARGT
ncbi:hypothetical protein L484_012456 [Morus notabilis]|uniref:Uncharacterized protein n=1 Tax=Morus notabilis TaxID=981085 RepID=W9R0Z3_9ROSA|nr:hypothetical protein L484_012456 [Morus notabilis]